MTDDGEPVGMGSSPLARGPLLASCQDGPTRGLIPARAGTTNYQNWVNAQCWAHPRSRGDHRPQLISTSPFRGSSPLARGPQDALAERPVGLGLIPARAGTTPARLATSVRVRAHPRSRGDHRGSLTMACPFWGSSPLARGPLRCLSAGNLDVGLIPARAGTTVRRRRHNHP